MPADMRSGPTRGTQSVSLGAGELGTPVRSNSVKLVGRVSRGASGSEAKGGCCHRCIIGTRTSLGSARACECDRAGQPCDQMAERLVLHVLTHLVEQRLAMRTTWKGSATRVAWSRCGDVPEFFFFFFFFFSPKKKHRTGTPSAGSRSVPASACTENRCQEPERLQLVLATVSKPILILRQGQ